MLRTNNFLLAVFLLLGFSATAQDKTQGVIHYDLTMFLHASLKPDQLQYKDMIPETASSQEILYFKGNKSKTSVKQPEQVKTEEGANVHIQMGDSETAFYEDGASGKAWALTEANGKKKLTEREHPASAQPGTGTRNILGFTCKAVIVKSKEGPLTLWVTPDLPFRGGPLHTWTSDGAVLGVDSKKFKAIATAINYEPIKDEEVIIPSL
ncbi:GLPGLI family protein [Chitinophaga qingshengii]|uniref:GLPGLI family protein n=1 Tax=Chitinophaga qingshengii TaxID=1569794 RepID=A0ABR7TRT7_9BACT|nr:GLPGLI family protein [Chitinophaga qingshengii]MBC9932099.1 GLPGLI family protein [Chitinophaga qingshengii]